MTRLLINGSELTRETTNPLISIIILNYNAGELLLECVNSVFHTNYDNYEIIVVDNASKDESHKKCKEKFDRIRLVENKDNLGYCEGNNVGIRQAKGDFLVILNPDTTVDPEWLKELSSAYNIFGDGLYQPKFLSSTDHSILLSAGNMIQIFGFGYSRGKGENLDASQFEKHEVIGYASGTCLFTSAKTMKKIGMFDSFLFAYHDDLNLGWRAALMGIKSHYVPNALVYHPFEGYSFKWSPLKFYLLERNRIYCLLTSYTRSTFYKMLPALTLIEIIVIIYYIKKGMFKLKIKGYMDLIKNRQEIKKQYHEIQKNRSVKDIEIIKNFSDDLLVPSEVANKMNNMLFNGFVKHLSKITRYFI